MVKGGHATGEQAVDVVVLGEDVQELDAARIDTANPHGTGCTFAASVAAGLASGLDPLDAIRQAKRYVTACISGGAHWDLGAGHGPLDHLGFSATTVPPFGPAGWRAAPV